MEFLVEPVDIDLLATFIVAKIWGSKSCETYCEDKVGCTPECSTYNC